MGKMWRSIQKLLCLSWCWATGGYAIWVKDTRDNSIELKVARRRFDPFTDDKVLEARWRIIGRYPLRNNGTLGESCQWRFVQDALHMEHQLRGTALEKT